MSLLDHESSLPDVQERTLATHVNYIASLLAAQHIHAEPATCYTSTWRMLILLPELFAAATFVEGWVVLDTPVCVVVGEHGWAELDGEIVDPTIHFFATPDAHLLYYPGVIRSHQETEALEGEMFPHVRFSGYGDDGLDHPHYRAAWATACAKAEQIAQASTPPKPVKVSPARDPQEDDAHGPDFPVPIIVFRL